MLLTGYAGRVAPLEWAVPMFTWIAGITLAAVALGVLLVLALKGLAWLGWLRADPLARLLDDDGDGDDDSRRGGRPV